VATIKLPALVIGIREEIKKAILAKDSKKSESLKYLFSLLEKEMLRRGSLSNEEALRIFQREMKGKKEALVLFKKSGRKDLIENEKREIALLAFFLPEEATEEEIRRLVKKIVAAGENDFGQIMSRTMGKLKGMAEGLKVAQIVREEIGQNEK